MVDLFHGVVDWSNIAQTSLQPHRAYLDLSFNLLMILKRCMPFQILLILTIADCKKEELAPYLPSNTYRRRVLYRQV